MPEPQEQFSAQDIQDLQQIRGMLKPDDPRVAKIDSALGPTYLPGVVAGLNRQNEQNKGGAAQAEIDKGQNQQPGFAESFLGAVGGPGSAADLEPPSTGEA